MTNSTVHPSPARLPSKVPPLQSGDRLTREEFERRYAAMPNIKAELIEGIVYMASPVNQRDHGAPHAKIITWLTTYSVATAGTDAGDNSTVRLDLKNEPQPDAFLMIATPRKGQAVLDEEGYVEGAPELCAEIAATSASYDLHDKLNAYRRNGVREYIVWRTLDNEIDWFVLRGEKYENLPRTPEGIAKSEVFPGLWLDMDALVKHNMKRVLEVLQQGLNTIEHTKFASGSGTPS